MPKKIKTKLSFLKEFKKAALNFFLPENFTLTLRKQIYQAYFTTTYNHFRNLMAQEVLKEKEAYKVVMLHTNWMDAWIHFTWELVFEERDLLLAELSLQSGQQLSHLENRLAGRKQKEIDLMAHLFTNEGKPIAMGKSEASYYKKSLSETTKDIKQLEVDLKILKEIIPQIPEANIKETKVLHSLLIFARGGFGREELTFSSDVDLGYCLNPDGLTSLELQTIQELIKRMEDLFHHVPLHFASQYFELNDDFSHFGTHGGLHAIPSILEGRQILGNPTNLKSLKNQILPVFSQEKMIRYLQDQLNALKRGRNEELYIKQGYGGIRHIHYTLWMTLILLNLDRANSHTLLKLIYDNGWIGPLDQQKILAALDFYFELRNFLGLYDCYAENLRQIGCANLIERRVQKLDFFDNQACMAYLKLKNRFTTIDSLDRFRLMSVETIAKLSQTIAAAVLDRTVSEYFDHFMLVKHVGTNQVIHFKSLQANDRKRDKKTTLHLGETSHQWAKKTDLDMFLKPANFFELFVYLAETGNRLNPKIIKRLSLLLPSFKKIFAKLPKKKIQNFIFALFTADKTSSAISQMFEISQKVAWDGEFQCLLGIFLQEVNQMRYLLRNLAVHEYPLCVHSMKTLEQVEKEIIKVQEQESELWEFVTKGEIFALKWSALFHDLGKINPYKDHEALGAELSTKILLRLGWKKVSEELVLIRLLVQHHQSIVRFSQLSTHLDLGILKTFDLADRDPKKVMFLYLINISDFKSVNKQFSKKAAHLEYFFDKTMSILDEFKREKDQTTIHRIIQGFLDRKKKEIRLTIVLNLLMRQCINKNLGEVILNPLFSISPKQYNNLLKYQKELENCLKSLSQPSLDPKFGSNQRKTFIRITRQWISEKNIYALAPLIEDLDWFFTSIPNRYLLSTTEEVLTAQLLQFTEYRNKRIRFSFVKGLLGEYDTFLFHSATELGIQAKIAYAINLKGMNIENGKINQIRFLNQKLGLVGFFRVSSNKGRDELSVIDLETTIANLRVPPLTPAKEKQSTESLFQIYYLTDKEKGYYVEETYPNQFKRIKKEFVVVKISLYDEPFCYFKIMKAFESLGIIPQQVTITTIGNQIIDYFSIEPEEKSRLIKGGFKKTLKMFLDSKISGF